jgi:hypothetical protein
VESPLGPRKRKRKMRKRKRKIKASKKTIRRQKRNKQTTQYQQQQMSGANMDLKDVEFYGDEQCENKKTTSVVWVSKTLATSPKIDGHQRADNLLTSLWIKAMTASSWRRSVSTGARLGPMINGLNESGESSKHLDHQALSTRRSWNDCIGRSDTLSHQDR